jgi:bacillithiol system protein YtxJ
MSIKLLNTDEEFQQVLDKEEPFYLLKHSLTCPISGEAKSEYEAFAKNSETPLYMLYVQEARPLSNKIAEDFKVKHESPQALYFDDDQIVWNASHWDITEKALQEVETKYTKNKEPK